MKKFLENNQYPHLLKQLSVAELPELAAEIREFILDIVSAKEGHLGASLGVVELTIALHYFFDTPHDQLIWDVGHQAYVHKILTGRKDDFTTLRQWNGLGGFPIREESAYDVFTTGHSSTSLSALAGIALADQLNGLQRERIAVIGDASIASGMAFEALNFLGNSNLNVWVILNDNNIGIDRAVGALKTHFNTLKTNDCSAFFQSLGFHYHGVVDGHSFDEIFTSFHTLQNIKGPKLLHLRTVKGKGYSHAEKDQVQWHAPGKFDKSTGQRAIKQKDQMTYAQWVGEVLHRLFEQNQKLTAITPAMPTGSGLINLMHTFPQRTFDVGIAEQHAVTMAAGMATHGLKPYTVIYSTFLQRAYDQVIHDVALQNLPVVFCVDRAGLVGHDGATHQGVFDLAYMNAIPNMLVAAPLDEIELQNLLYTAQFVSQPISIRYPRGNVKTPDQLSPFVKVPIGKAICKKAGHSLAVCTTGQIGQNVAAILEKTELPFTWMHFPFVKPLDTDAIASLASNHQALITIEEGVKVGGFASNVLQCIADLNLDFKVETMGVPDVFVPHGSVADQLTYCQLTQEAILQKIQAYFD